jgi:hypothetical protein
VLQRLTEVEELDGAQIASMIEHTRFPYSSAHTRFPYSSAPDDHDIDEWAALLRAADLLYPPRSAWPPSLCGLALVSRG